VRQRKAVLFEPAPPVDPAVAVDRRDAVVRVLVRLPPRQRAVLVLRYFEQLSEAETAQALGCSVGTVKSASARGLARLREMTVSAESAEAAAAKE
jgi:RNA polymerase sigma factor (sigma-70 family)